MKKIAGGFLITLVLLGLGYYFLKYKPGKQRGEELVKLIAKNPNFDPVNGKTPAQITAWAKVITDSEYKAVSTFLNTTGTEKEKFAAAAKALSLTAEQVTLLITNALKLLK